MVDMGLRERKKIQRRAEIIAAAHRLFTERGYDATTVADIAAAADVAPRTVSLYFPTKQDIALAGISDLAGRLTGALRDREPGAAMIETVASWLRTELANREASGLDVQRKMLDANPELRALGMAHVDIAVGEGRRAIAAELGVPADDPRVRIAITAIGSVIEDIFGA